MLRAVLREGTQGCWACAPVMLYGDAEEGTVEDAVPDRPQYAMLDDGQIELKA